VFGAARTRSIYEGGDRLPEVQFVPRAAAPDPWIARPNQQEQFSDAFLLAIAAAAGCASSRPVPDNDSIDWTLSCRLSRRPKLDIQLKSTIHPKVEAGDIRYRLKMKNYNDLILEDLVAPRILVLVTVPRRVEDWLCLTPDNLLLRYSAYWESLAGAPRMRNNKSCTVIIRERNLLTPAVLRSLMMRINDGEPL
jgi:Domain of unknown function (DUF4365)